MSIKTKRIEGAISFIISMTLALIFGFSSPLHPWIGSEAGTDSSVFKTVTLMMEHGLMPYKDSVDHKGPFLYILNWIGNRISQYRGIWVIEIVVIGFSLFMMYKIARLSCGVVASVITVLTSSSLLFMYFEGGNLTEEYAMPCIAVGVYIFLDYLMNSKISRPRLVISGLCCGIVLLLRPNMITVWFVYCITITVKLLWKKSIKEWAEFAIWFLIGLVVIILPIAIWLGINNDIYYCFHDYIRFNMQYSSTEGGRALFSSKWSSFFNFYNSVVYICAFFSIVFHIKNQNRLLSISYLIYLLLSIAFMVMSGMAYGHYGMVLIPAVVFPISIIFSDIGKISEKNVSDALLLISSLYLLSVVILPNWIGVISSIPIRYETKDENHRNDTTVNITNLIDQYTDEDDKISVYGNWDIIYVLSDRMHATRFSYQFPIGEVMPEIMEEYMDSLQQELPKAIVVQSGRYDENIQTFLKNNGYQLCYSSYDGTDLEENLNSKSLLFIKQK